MIGGRYFEPVISWPFWSHCLSFSVPQAVVLKKRLNYCKLGPKSFIIFSPILKKILNIFFLKKSVWKCSLLPSLFRNESINFIEAKWHIYAPVNYVIIGSDNGLAPVWCKPLYEPMLVNSSLGIMEKDQWSLNRNSIIFKKKMSFKMLSAISSHLCSGVKVLNITWGSEWLISAIKKRDTKWGTLSNPPAGSDIFQILFYSSLILVFIIYSS